MHSLDIARISAVWPILRWQGQTRSLVLLVPSDLFRNISAPIRARDQSSQIPRYKSLPATGAKAGDRLGLRQKNQEELSPPPRRILSGSCHWLKLLPGGSGCKCILSPQLRVRFRISKMGFTGPVSPTISTSSSETPQSQAVLYLPSWMLGARKTEGWGFQL